MQDGLYMGYMGYIEILPQSWGIKTKKMETGTAFVCIYIYIYMCNLASNWEAGPTSQARPQPTPHVTTSG